MTSDLCHLAFEGFRSSLCLNMGKSSASPAPTILRLQLTILAIDDTYDTCNERI